MLWIVRDNNGDATKYYLDIIERAAVKAGQEVGQVNNVEEALKGSKKDVYLATTPIDAIKLYFKGRKKIIMWFQGVFSEESYLRHKSIGRKTILGRIEKFILKKSKIVIFVSEEMKRYYTERFQIDVNGKHYIMPCFNSNINKNSFMDDDKYRNNVFCYAGSLSIWQGFNKILECYKRIETLWPDNTKLLILTKERKEAEFLVKEANIKNYEIDYVSLEELPSVLGKAKFGFIIRDDIVVNRVSTPTKISTYMANGLIPIYSSCLVDFHKQISNNKYTINFDVENFEENIKYFINHDIQSEEIYEEYEGLFDTYYNADYHVYNISKLIKNYFSGLERM